MPRKTKTEVPMVWLSPSQIAIRAGVSERTVYAWMNDPGEPLPSVKAGRRVRRIHVDVFDEWFANRGEKGADVDSIVAEIVGGIR